MPQNESEVNYVQYPQAQMSNQMYGQPIQVQHQPNGAIYSQPQYYQPMQPQPQQYQINYPVQPNMVPQEEQFYYYENGQEEGEEDPNDPMFWNKKFFFIFERFEWAFERCEMLKADYE